MLFIIIFTIAIVLMFFMNWGALQKNRLYDGVQGRLFFSWHVVQFAMVFLLVLGGNVLGGAGYKDAFEIFGRWQFWTGVFVAGPVYMILMRIWKFKVPKWF